MKLRTRSFIPHLLQLLKKACQTDLQAEDVPLLQPHVRSRAIPSSDSGDFGHELAPKLVGMELRYTLPADDDRLRKSSTRLLLVAGGGSAGEEATTWGQDGGNLGLPQKREKPEPKARVFMHRPRTLKPRCRSSQTSKTRFKAILNLFHQAKRFKSQSVPKPQEHQVLRMEAVRERLLKRRRVQEEQEQGTRFGSKLGL